MPGDGVGEESPASDLPFRAGDRGVAAPAGAGGVLASSTCQGGLRTPERFPELYFSGRVSCGAGAIGDGTWRDDDGDDSRKFIRTRFPTERHTDAGQLSGADVQDGGPDFCGAATGCEGSGPGPGEWHGRFRMAAVGRRHAEGSAGRIESFASDDAAGDPAHGPGD